MERTSRMDSKRNLIFTIGVAVIVLIYLTLRLSFPETIEFGYDQPRLATRVIEFIENGNILETQKFAEKAPWGNISWGPALFYFFVPFLMVTKNPLAISYFISIFNIISILGVMYLTTKYISKKAGLVASLFLATQPWWVIFSRMIYQPAPVITLVILSMYLFFKSAKNINSIFYSALIFSWVFLIEIYFHTTSFVVLSLLLLVIYNRKKVFNKYLVIGIIISLLLIIPFFVNFKKDDYLPVESQTFEDKFKIGRDDPVSRLKTIIPGFFKTMAGGNMEYQLGYSFTKFNTENPIFNYTESMIIILVFCVLIFNSIRAIKTSRLRFERIALLLWSVSSIFFLIFMPLPNLPPIPRYFLVSIPSVSILFGLFFSEVYNYSKVILVLLIIPISWIYFTYSYSKFIMNYNFPNGHLSVYSDSQYLFLFDAIKTARFNNFKNGRIGFILSNDESKPKEMSMDYATKYVLTNVFNYKMVNNMTTNNGYYLIDYSLQKEDVRFKYLDRFGPYSLYEFNDL